MRTLLAILAATALQFCTRGASADQLYWNSGGAIHRAATDGTNVENLAATFNNRGIALDGPGNKMYWTDVFPSVPISPTGVIRRADLGGGGQVDLLPAVQDPIGIALDTLHGKMYWTAEDGAVRRANLDGSAPQEIIHQPSISDLSGLALDPLGDRLYFSFVNPLIDSTRPGGIGSTRLDGSDFQMAVGALVEPRGLALDLLGEKIYWADQNRIEGASLGGGPAEPIASNLLEPYGLALDLSGQTLYFSDRQAGAVEKISLASGNLSTVLSNLSDPTALALLPAVPEPTSLTLVACGVLCMGLWRARRISFAGRQIN